MKPWMTVALVTAGIAVLIFLFLVPRQSEAKPSTSPQDVLTAAARSRENKEKYAEDPRAFVADFIFGNKQQRSDAASSMFYTPAEFTADVLDMYSAAASEINKAVDQYKGSRDKFGSGMRKLQERSKIIDTRFGDSDGVVTKEETDKWKAAGSPGDPFL